MPTPIALTPKRRSRERASHRRAILAAARRLFARKGYGSTTLEEIARRAEFGKGTLYGYFRNKEDLFDHMVEGLLGDLLSIARVVSAGPGGARDKFRRYALLMMSYYRRNGDYLRIVSREINTLESGSQRRRHRRILAGFREIAALLGSNLRAEVGAGMVVSEDPTELAQVFVALLHNRSIRRSLERGGLASLNPGEEADFITRLYFEGVSIR
ncbi:MAG: TetR/AcrR family transcriptional regulator [Bacteroidota bacterium]